MTHDKESDSAAKKCKKSLSAAAACPSGAHHESPTFFQLALNLLQGSFAVRKLLLSSCQPGDRVSHVLVPDTTCIARQGAVAQGGGQPCRQAGPSSAQQLAQVVEGVQALQRICADGSLVLGRNKESLQSARQQEAGCSPDVYCMPATDGVNWAWYSMVWDAISWGSVWHADKGTAVGNKSTMQTDRVTLNGHSQYDLRLSRNQQTPKTDPPRDMPAQRLPGCALAA